MTSPYIQCELDALSRFPRVAQLCGLPKMAITDGMIELWAHCYREQVDELTVDELAGFFPESQRLLKALATYGFVEVLGKLVRVRGIDRYRRVKEARSEAGKKGGKARSGAPREGGRFVKANKGLQPSTTQLSGDAGQRTTQVSGERVVKPGREVKPAPAETVKPTKPNPLSPNGPTVAPPCSTTQLSGDAGQRTTQVSGDCLEALAPNTTQNQPLYPRFESLSPSERETLREGAPAQRESHAPPPEGAGRDSRTGTSEGTRGEMAAVPESPAPAPRPLPPSRKPTPKPVPEYRPPPDPDPIESRSWLWDAHEMPRKAPPDDEWVNAVVWRLKRLTRVPDAIVRKSEWPGVQASVEQSYVVAAEEAAGMVPGIAGLVLLGELDDREQAIDGGFAADLIRWLRERAEHLEPMVERERLAVDQGEEVELVH